ncbi:TPA: hypothetical protein ACGSZ4_004567, partial [Escherichia coli]
SRYGQRGQGVNGGSVKIWTGVWVKQAGCCYSTVVVTQWNTDVKNSQWASGYIVAARQQPILWFAGYWRASRAQLRLQPKLRSPVQ